MTIRNPTQYPAREINGRHGSSGRCAISKPSAIKENPIESPAANADHPNADPVRCSSSSPLRRMVS
jgi:hypothetical protein